MKEKCDCTLFFHVVSEGPSPVRIIYPVTSRNLTVDQSGSLTLECVVSGSRSLKVKWIKDGAELSLNSKRMLLQSNLVLNDVQLRDGGHYCCSVLTDHGAVVSVNYTVNVLGKELILLSHYVTKVWGSLIHVVQVLPKLNCFYMEALGNASCMKGLNYSVSFICQSQNFQFSYTGNMQ